MGNYISRLDEIDKWLFDSFGILPGCGCSQENLRHTTARMVAEVLWPKKNLALTWEDIATLIRLCEQVKTEWWFKDMKGIGTQKHFEEVLRRFNEQRKK